MEEELPQRVQARRGCSLVHKGKTLLSLIDPERQAARISSAAPVFKQTLYICASPLFGYGIRELLGRITEDSGVLCVEADAALCSFSLDGLPPEAACDPRLRFSHLENGAAACAFVRREYGQRRFRRTVVVKLSGGYGLNPTKYEDIERSLREEMALEWSNAMTLVRLGRRYALNAVRNLALLPIARSLDKHTFGAKPILVLGAGPSLDDADSLIRQDREYSIICVDTALKPLLDRGVEPDLVVALEAQHWNLRDFIGTSRGKFALALDLTALPTESYYRGRDLFLFSVGWTDTRLLERLAHAHLRPPEIPPLGSVGLAAVSVALRCGTGPVVVAGLDFAYGVGAYHARSAPSRIEGYFKTDRLKSLIDPAPAFRNGTVATHDKHGRATRTDPTLRDYRALFEREFADAGRIYDAAERGLDLGVPRLSLAEAQSVLNGETSPAEQTGYSAIASLEATIDFILREKERLQRLRSALVGESSSENLEKDLDECDYLWQHFPECAGAGGKRPAADDLSFLKRVRAEIDPFGKAFGIALSELRRR